MSPGPEFELISQLAPRMRTGELTAQALLDRCLARIEAHDKRGAALHAMLSLNPKATAEASALDDERVAQGVRGPLHGMPLVVKDNIDVAGMPTTSGALALAKAWPRVDAETVRRLRAAGAVIVGKTNMSEFSFEIRSRSSLGGDVLNPFDRGVTAGGSSGGTAASIAAGFAVAGLGTDTGGSIRTPAAFTGLVALRPTHGLLDLDGVAPLAPTADVVAPMARSSADISTLMAVLTDRFRALPRVDLAGVRVGVLRQGFGDDDEVKRAMATGLQALSAGGATLIDPIALAADVWPDQPESVVDWEVRPAFDAYLSTNFIPATVPTSLAMLQAGGEILPDHAPAMERRLASPGLSDPAYRTVLARRAALATALAQLVEHHRLDALAYPTSVVVPQSLENPAGGCAPELAAAAGWPALTMPAGRSRRGVPIGFELLAPRLQEPQLLALGDALEQRLGLRYFADLG